jgi:hypothetical protein
MTRRTAASRSLCYDNDMAIVLPPSLMRDRHPVSEEVAWARSLTPEQRLEVVAMLCRDTVKLLALNPKRDRVLSMRDPVPDSTVRALARLRRAT